MKNYKVLLYTEEEGFAFALMNYINRNPQVPILLMAFTKRDEMEQYLNEHSLDLIVMEAEFLGDNMLEDAGVLASIIKDRTVPILWMLKEEKGEVCETLYSQIRDKNMVISQYSTGSVYIRRMLQILSEEKPFMNMAGSCTCVGVYSPIGRCGKTELAKALCRYYSTDNSNSGRLCIYLGLEEFAENPDERHSMEELLYYVKQRAENISMKMKFLAMEEQGYDWIPGSASYQELRELKREDLSWFLNQIRTEGYYNWLVADIGSGSLSDLELLTEFDVLYLPYLQENRSRCKVKGFYHCMQGWKNREWMEEHCYPVLMREKERMLGEVQNLEQKRRKGSLKSIGKEEDVFGTGGFMQ